MMSFYNTHMNFYGNYACMFARWARLGWRILVGAPVEPLIFLFCLPCRTVWKSNALVGPCFSSSLRDRAWRGRLFFVEVKRAQVHGVDGVPRLPGVHRGAGRGQLRLWLGVAVVRRLESRRDSRGVPHGGTDVRV